MWVETVQCKLPLQHTQNCAEHQARSQPWTRRHRAGAAADRGAGRSGRRAPASGGHLRRARLARRAAAPRACAPPAWERHRLVTRQLESSCATRRRRAARRMGGVGAECVGHGSSGWLPGQASVRGDCILVWARQLQLQAALKRVLQRQRCSAGRHGLTAEFVGRVTDAVRERSTGI